MNPKHLTISALFLLSLYPYQTKAQISNLDKGLIIGNLLIQGYQAIRGNNHKEVNPNAKTVDTFCFKNKLDQKITVKLLGKDEDEEEVNKELVIQSKTKECVFNLPKGVYVYEFVLPNKEIYQKGEYKVAEETLMTVKGK